MADYVTFNLNVGKDPGKPEKRKTDQQKRARSWRRVIAKKLMCNVKGAIQGENRFLKPTEYMTFVCLFIFIYIYI